MAQVFSQSCMTFEWALLVNGWMREQKLFLTLWNLPSLIYFVVRSWFLKGSRQIFIGAKTSPGRKEIKTFLLLLLFCFLLKLCALNCLRQQIKLWGLITKKNSHYLPSTSWVPTPQKGPLSTFFSLFFWCLRPYLSKNIVKLLLNFFSSGIMRDMHRSSFYRQIYTCPLSMNFSYQHLNLPK